MHIDKLNEFADATSVAAAAGTANIGSQIDLLAANIQPGVGQPVYVAITVDVSIITGGAAGTIAFQLASDDSASIATNGTQTVHWTSKLFVTDDDALNELDAGAKIFFALPAPLPTYERYLGIQAVIATTTVTAGSISAFLTWDANYWKAFADAVN